MRVLLICDDFYHPAKTLEPIAAFLEKEGIKTDILREVTGIDFDELLSNYEVVILSKSGQELTWPPGRVRTANTRGRDAGPWQTEAAVQAFKNYANRGGGLVFAHSGIVSDNADMQKLIGCKFLSHPEEQCPVTFLPKKPHPIMDGVEPFTVTDEHYYIEILDEAVEILALYETPEVRMPGCCVHEYGKGRVCCITPGHNAPVWLNSNFQRLVWGAVRWCGERGKSS